MQIEKLRNFIDLAESRSFSRTAEKAFLSQSAVSQQLAALEKELGVKLVERSRKGRVSLTPAGEVFYEGCRKTVYEYDRMMRETAQYKENVRIVTVALNSGSGSIDWLIRVNEELSENLPPLRVRPVFGGFGALRDMLLDGSCDCAVSIEFGLTDVPGAVYEEIMTLEPQLLVSRKHRLAGRSSVRPEELSEELFVTIAREYSPHVYTQWKEARAADGITVRHVELVETAQVQGAMVEMNEGVAILPVLPDLSQFSKEKCTAVRIEGTRERVRYVVACREERKDDPAIRKFMDLTKQYYGRITDNHN